MRTILPPKTTILIAVTLGISILGWQQWSLAMSATLPTTIRELALLRKKDLTQLPEHGVERVVHKQLLGLVEEIAHFVDGPLNDVREKLLVELELEASLLRGQDGGEATVASEQYLHLGIIGMRLGSINELETRFREVSSLGGRISLGGTSEGAVPLAAETYSEFRDRLYVALVQFNSLVSSGVIDSRHSSLSRDLEGHEIALVTAWEGVLGGRVRRGVSPDIVVDETGLKSHGSLQVNDLGELFFRRLDQPQSDEPATEGGS